MPGLIRFGRRFAMMKLVQEFKAETSKRLNRNRMTFPEEFREIGRRHGMNLDERYAGDEGRPDGTWCNSQLGSQGSGRLASSPCLALGFVSVVPTGR